MRSFSEHNIVGTNGGKGKEGIYRLAPFAHIEGEWKLLGGGGKKNIYFWEGKRTVMNKKRVKRETCILICLIKIT